MHSTHPRIRTLVVQAHPTLRQALCDLLACYSDIQVVGTAANGPDALLAAKSLALDVILMDVGLPGLSGIEVAKQLRRAVPSLRIILLTGHDILYVERATGNCAHAYLSKSQVEERAAELIRDVYRDASRSPKGGESVPSG